MGWDAYATMPDGQDVEQEWTESENGHLPTDPRIREAFAAAVRRARAMVQELGDPEGVIDGFLENAALDCSACAQVLEKATGRSAYEPLRWSPEDVQELARTAVFPKASDHLHPWAVASAWEFLTTCAALGLGIRFSW